MFYKLEFGLALVFWTGRNMEFRMLFQPSSFKCQRVQERGSWFLEIIVLQYKIRHISTFTYDLTTHPVEPFGS